MASNLYKCQLIGFIWLATLGTKKSFEHQDYNEDVQFFHIHLYESYIMQNTQPNNLLSIIKKNFRLSFRNILTKI